MNVLLSTPQITSVRLRGLDTYNFPFTYGVSDSDSYLVKQIDGIDAPDQDVAIAKTASGGKFQGVQSADRDITIQAFLNKADVKVSRNNLYTMLRTGHDPKVWVDLMEGTTLFAMVEAYCTKFDAALFVKEPFVQFTLRTLHPTFRTLFPVSYPGSSLSEHHPNIYNQGTADAGFQFAVKFTAAMSRWYIKTAEDNSIGMTFDKNFNSGDLLEVSTIPGNRYIHWKKAGGAVKNMMGILREDSEWLMLHPGHNVFTLPSQTSSWQWKGPLTFTPQYWGV